MKRSGECIALYSRKSKFTGKGESIANQVDLCREYVRLHYGEDALERVRVYEDEGFSGGDLNRPGFRALLAAAKARELQAVVVYRLDRISRDVSDFSGLIEELSRLNIAFVSIREQFDTATPMGRAMMYIASVFSQLERETIAERIRDNMHELAKTGRWLGGVTPIGYTSESVKSVSVDGKQKKACRLKLVPEEAETVRTVFWLFQRTNSLAETEAELLRRRMATRGGKPFSRFSIKAILQNPVYMAADQYAYDYFIENGAEVFADCEEFDGVHGVMAYNRTDQQKGRAAILRPVAEWIVSVGQHPGLVSGRAWINVQKVLERNKSKTVHTPRGNNALLTGLLYCGCGGKMYPKLSRSRTERGERSFYYACKRKEKSHGCLCAAKNVNGNALDRAVIERLKLLEEDRDSFTAQMKSLKNSIEEDHSMGKERFASLQKKQKDTEKAMDALACSLAALNDRAARAVVAGRMEALAHEYERTQADIRQQLDAALSPNDIGECDAFPWLCSFQDCMEKSSIEQKRGALRTLVERIMWDGTCAHLILHGANGEANTLWGEDSK